MYHNDVKISNLPENKVDTICDLLLEAMSKNKQKYILPIISCHVKNSKSKIDDALQEIKTLKGTIQEKYSGRNPAFFQSRGIAGLKNLISRDPSYKLRTLKPLLFTTKPTKML